MIETLMVIAGLLAAAVLALVFIASRKPDSFAIERSTEIRAAANDIYPLIASLPRMNTWNPFVQPDPAIEITYSGAEAGKGAVHTWRGNRHVGAGRIEITDAAPPSRIEMRLQMFKPMKADNQVLFTLEPAGNGTQVTWRMTGPQPLMGKVLSMLIDCEKMLGPTFEKGLTSLKAQAEGAGSLPRQPPTDAPSWR